jgi:hypothetical protein
MPEITPAANAMSSGFDVSDIVVEFGGGDLVVVATS